MKLTIYDTISQLKSLYVDPMHPKERFARAQEPGGILGAGGLFERLKAGHRDSGLTMMEAAQRDGIIVAKGQQVWGMFNPTRKLEATAWVFAQFSEYQLLETSQQHLANFAHPFDEANLPAEIECIILPADPANRPLMIDQHGVAGFGGAKNYMLLQIWPSPDNLAQLGPALARLFVHNLRWSQMAEGHIPTLADFLVLEGLAASFVAEAFPDQSVEPWLLPNREPDDWPTTLQTIASQFYQEDSYNDVTVNIYGAMSKVGPERPPQAKSLETEDLAYAQAVIAEALDEAEPTQIAAHLYGDEVVALQGHATVGLPSYAGFEVGYRLVQDYVEQTGSSVAEIIDRPTAELCEIEARQL